MNNMDEMPKKSLPKIIGVSALAVFVLVGVVLTNEYVKTGKYLAAAVSTASVTVGNSLPVASSPSLHGETPIIPLENATTSAVVTGTVTDTNGCLDLASVKVAVYKTGTTCSAGGDANNDTCYLWTDSSPSTNGSCTGGADTTYAVNHSFDIQYYTDPGTWYTTITPTDTVGVGTQATSSGTTINSLQALAVSSTISYGSVSNVATSTGDHTATVTDTGNTAIDYKISGADLTCSTLGSIPVGNEQYGLNSFSYGSGIALSTTPTDVNADLATTTQGNVPVTDPTYWQVSVPAGVNGICSGNVTFAAEAAL